MKKNLDFLIILFVCLLVSSVLYVLYGIADENSSNNVILRKDGGNVRSHVRSSSYNSAFSGGFIAGDAIPAVGTSGRAVSSTRISASSSAPTLSRGRGASSYSPISSSVASSTDGARKIALGNGGSANYSKGGSMIASSSQMVTYGGSVTNISLPTNRRNSSAIVNGEVAAVGRSYSPSMVNVSGSYATIYDSYRISMNGNSTSLYRDASSVFGVTSGLYRASRQHRAPPGTGGSGLGDSWGNSVGDWLNGHRPNEEFGDSIGGVWWFNETEAGELYDELFGEGSEYWNDGMGNPPTEDDFLDWLRRGEGKYRMPIGDILPLFFIALAYVVFVFVSKRKN